LQHDGGHEVTVREFRVQGFDFVVQAHHAALTIAALKYVLATELPSIPADEAVM
jgi:hypothetical protein